MVLGAKHPGAASKTTLQLCCSDTVVTTYQTFRHGRLVALRQVLLQGQDDAVGDDGSQDHVLEWSARVKEHVKIKDHSQQQRHCGSIEVNQHSGAAFQMGLNGMNS